MNELIISCDRRFSFTRYEGTREQIEATGLIPAGIKWPDAFDTAEWEAGGLSFRIRRLRPEGAKGRKSDFVTCDNWTLFSENPKASIAKYDIQQKAEELRRLQYAQTLEGQKEMDRHFQMVSDARWDDEFQAFKALIPALVQRRKKDASKSAPITQGGAA